MGVYVSFILLQICTTLLVGYITGFANLIVTLISLPFDNNPILKRIFTFINVLLQNYIAVSVLLGTTFAFYDYYLPTKKLSIISLVVISFLCYFLNIYTSAYNRFKNETDYELKNQITINMFLSIIIAIVLFVLLYCCQDLIWFYPGLLLCRFILWITKIRIVGSIFNFVLTAISGAVLLHWVFTFVLAIFALIAAAIDKINK